MGTPSAHGHTEGGSFCCCGLAEYDGLNLQGFTPEGALVSIVRGINAVEVGSGGIPRYDDWGEPASWGSSHVVMTQRYTRGRWADQGKNLRAFASYVRKHDLGQVVMAHARRNPNSGNMIKAAIFAPNPRKLAEWAKARGMDTVANERDRWAPPHF